LKKENDDNTFRDSQTTTKPHYFYTRM